MKDNLKLIEPPSGHKVVKTLVLISLGILKQNIHYFKNLCIETLKATLNLWIILNTMWNPPSVEVLWLPIFKYATTLTLFQSKKLTCKHYFPHFIVANNVCTLQTMIQTNCTQKSKLENNCILKHITIIYKSNKKMQNK